MERKKKSALCNKVISLFTSLLMVLSTIIGYIPTSAVSVSAADSYPLQEISSGTKLSTLRTYNPERDILINPTPEKISGYSTNDDFDKNKDGSLWKDKSGRYLRIRTKSGFAEFNGKQWDVEESKFHPTITYYKAGYDKKNKQYYNLTMRVEKYESDGYIWYMADSSTRDKQYSKITTKPECPYIYIDTKKSSVGISGLKNVQCSFTWSRYVGDNDSEEIPADQVAKLNSYITIRDLDDGQAMKIAGNQKGKLDVYKLKGSKFITEQDGWYVSKSGETTSPSDKKSWVQALLTGNPTFIMWFRANEPNKVVHDTEYNKQWGMPANTCYSWNKNNAGMISGNYFEYTAESLINTIPVIPTPTPGGDPEPNDPSIEKVVVQKGGSYDDAYKAASPEDAFEINDYDDYDYLIKTAGPGAETDSYEIVDTLEDCLTIDDTHHITITDKDGTNVSNDFNLSIKGQTITASAKADYMKSSDFKKADQEFMVRLTVHRIKTNDVYTFMAPWIANDPENTGYTFYVPNASTVRYHVKDAKETTQLDSEECWVTDEIKSKLTVEKDAKYDDWKPDTPDTPDKPGVGGMTITKTANKNEVSVGDVVSYTLSATVNSGKETAKNVVITDTLDADLFEHLEIVKDSFRSYLDDSEFHGADLSISSTGFTLKSGKDMKPGQVMKVTYDVKVKDDTLKGKTFKNIATVSSDNMDTAKDKESVKVKTDDPVEGGMTISKKANQSKVSVGDTVSYTLEAKVNSGTDTAKNVVIKDTVDSAYAKYVSIDRSSVHCYIDNSEFAPKSLDVTENGFTVTSGKDLKPGQVMKVTYDMKVVSDKLKGKSIKNAAVVSSDNMNPGNDTEIVEVPSDKPVTGGLNLTKIGDHSQINVGDTVKYTLIGKTTSADTAVNVVIKDALDNKGVIDESSIKAYLDDQLFTPKKLSVTDDGFTMETGKDLAAKQILKVTYSVRFADESLAGKTVKNTAVISSDNMDPVDADHGVTVNPKEEEKPALSIDKSVNLSSASVGDTLSYTLTVKETEKDQTAKNVVVRDNFDTTGMKVGGIQATLDGKSIKADVTKADNGFVVNTNTDLAYGSTLKITYQAAVSDSSLAGKMVGNTAIASADNADDVAANAGVSIAENPSPSETPAPSTTPAPGADSSDNTTNTVGPKTGLVNHAGMYAGIGLGIVAVAAIAVFVMRRKKK